MVLAHEKTACLLADAVPNLSESRSVYSRFEVFYFTFSSLFALTVLATVTLFMRSSKSSVTMAAPDDYRHSGVDNQHHHPDRQRGCLFGDYQSRDSGSGYLEGFWWAL